MANSSGFPGALGKKQERARKAEQGGGPKHTDGWGGARSAGRQGHRLKHDVTPLMWQWSFQPPSIQQNPGQSAGPAAGADNSGGVKQCGRRKYSLWGV